MLFYLLHVLSPIHELIMYQLCQLVLSLDKSVGKIWSLAVGLSKYNLSHFLGTCAKYTFSAHSLLSRDFLQFIANCLHEDKKSPDVQGLLFFCFDYQISPF